MKQTESLTDKQNKQRRFLLVVPIIILPFLTFLFWSLGLVGSNQVQAAPVRGLNMQVPDAKLKENKSWNKLSFYEQADKDSARYKDAVNNDPFFHRDNDSLSQTLSNVTNSPLGYNPLPPDYEDPNENKVTQKLAQLNAAINNINNDNSLMNNHNKTEQDKASFQAKDVDRLEHLLQSINQPDSGTDPETKQLNGMMDKILDIQHPEQVSKKIQQESEKTQKAVFPVVTKQSNSNISLLQNYNQAEKVENKRTVQLRKQNAFYSLDADITTEDKQNVIKAEVQQTQTIVSGSTVKLISATDVYVNGILIPKGTLLYGIASQNGERLNITITSIHYQNNLLPVSLSVYDLDGLEGIYIPGSLSRDAVKQSGSEAVNNIGITSLDPSLGAQAANAGIAAAKSLMNKKVKQVKLTIKAGYRVLLKDNNVQ